MMATPFPYHHGHSFPPPPNCAAPFWPDRRPMMATPFSYHHGHSFPPPRNCPAPFWPDRRPMMATSFSYHHPPPPPRIVPVTTIEHTFMPSYWDRFRHEQLLRVGDQDNYFTANYLEDVNSIGFGGRGRFFPQDLESAQSKSLYNEANTEKSRQKTRSYATRPVSFVSNGVMGSETLETIAIEAKGTDHIIYGNRVVPSLPNYREFEMHTTGFGSRMLTKMGYVDGEGLGKDGQGIAEPIEVVYRHKSLGLGLKASETRISKPMNGLPMTKLHGLGTSGPTTTVGVDGEELGKDEQRIVDPIKVNEQLKPLGSGAKAPETGTSETIEATQLQKSLGLDAKASKTEIPEPMNVTPQFESHGLESKGLKTVGGMNKTQLVSQKKQVNGLDCKGLRKSGQGTGSVNVNQGRKSLRLSSKASETETSEPMNAISRPKLCELGPQGPKTISKKRKTRLGSSKRYNNESGCKGVGENGRGAAEPVEMTQLPKSLGLGTDAYKTDTLETMSVTSQPNLSGSNGQKIVSEMSETQLVSVTERRKSLRSSAKTIPKAEKGFECKGLGKNGQGTEPDRLVVRRKSLRLGARTRETELPGPMDVNSQPKLHGLGPMGPKTICKKRKTHLWSSK